MSEFSFDKVGQEYRGAYHDGQLKFQSSSFTFKNKKTNKSEQIQNEDIDKMYWIKRSKGHCFKVVLKNGTNYKFDGFGENDFKKLEDYSNLNIKKPIEKLDLAVKGWNWGKTAFNGDSLNFEIDNKMAFEIPLKNVSNTNASKNEAVLQFHQNEDASVALMEIRFHIPSNPSDENAMDTANEFIKNVLAKADLQKASEGDSICTLTELNCVTPRGRYDVKFFIDFIDLHGKTFDYKISYDHILRLFLLPHKDGRQMYFVVAMDPPIKQGNTRYPFLIFLFNTDEEINVDLNVSEKTKEKYGDRLEKLNELSGPYHEVVSRICRIVLDKKITVPGNFNTAAGAKCFACSYKASSGFLYPLERGFIFVNKPAMHILFSDISAVKFDRSSQGTRSFDFEIEHTNGSKFLFSGIEKNEQEKFQEFVKTKGMKIGKSSEKLLQTQLEMDDDDESDQDHYAERMKAEGRRGKATAQQDDDDDDDDEDDEDFEGGSTSEDDIEYDSEASIDSDSSAESGSDDGKKKKSSKKPSPSKSKSSKSKSSNKSPSKRKSGDSGKEKGDSAKKSSKPADKENGKTPKSAEFVPTESEESESD